MSAKRNKHYREEASESYFVSMTDIMVGLLFIFVLIIMYFAFQLKVQTEAQDNYAQTASDHRTMILENIKTHLENAGVLNVQIDTEQGLLRLPEGVLFDSGVAEILPNTPADIVSNKLSNAFVDVLRCSVFGSNNKPLDVTESCASKNVGKVFLESVLIEGHTDNIPIGKFGLRGDSKLNSNLRLSARRATNTYEKLVEYSPTLSDFKSPQNEALFAVSAYGERRPIADNSLKAGRNKNRRIDIRLLMYVPATSSTLFDYKRQLRGYYEAN